MFTPELKLEVGKFAYQFGISKCLEEYHSRQPPVELSRHQVQRFLSLFLEAHPSLLSIEDGSRSSKADGGNRLLLSQELSRDIGKFAHEHGSFAAVRHFSEQLHFPLKEEVVKRLKIAWIEQSEVSSSNLFSHPQKFESALCAESD